MVYRNMQENTPHTPRRGNETTTTTASSSTTTSTGSTTTVELYQDMDNSAVLRRLSFEAIKEKFCEVIGRPMPPSIARELLLDLEGGAASAYYTYALDEAAYAPQPSWRYVMAIVRRLRREHVPPEDLLPWY